MRGINYGFNAALNDIQDLAATTSLPKKHF